MHTGPKAIDAQEIRKGVLETEIVEHTLSRGEVNEENWKPVYTKILLMYSRNIDVKRIAKDTKLSTRRVAYLRASPYFKARLAAIHNQTITRSVDKSVECITEAKEILSSKAITAARKLVQMMNKRILLPTERLRFDIVRDVLDRVGLKAVDIIETREKKYTPEEIMEMHTTMVEIEAITQRLNNNNSRFLMQPTAGSPSTDESSAEIPDLSETEAVPEDRTLPSTHADS